jgi:hypothetical protein
MFALSKGSPECNGSQEVLTSFADLVRRPHLPISFADLVRQPHRPGRQLSASSTIADGLEFTSLRLDALQACEDAYRLRRWQT